ncbi:hypothetical protein ElyMa_004216100 [Elysia marginata]|uniref:Uncharacterized protein n=1 Tax=Elysia marginata TaxID=1093978 RepID=A0AAV4GP50_9GAST|nr:hypothetical protein ElyMa_004216100 [Elysia marginata]
MIYSAIAAILVLSGNVVAPPPNESTIDNPCRAVFSSHPIFPTLSSSLFEIIGEINMANYSAEILKTTLTTPAYIPEDALGRYDLDSMHVPNLPLWEERDNVNVTVNDMEWFLRQAYRDISIHIIFVTEALREQTSSGVARLLVLEFTDVRRFFYNLLCKMDTLIKSRGISLTDYEDESVLPAVFSVRRREVMRFMKHYVHAKDVMTFLTNLKPGFVQLFDEVQGSLP